MGYMDGLTTYEKVRLVTAAGVAGVTSVIAIALMKAFRVLEGEE